MMPEKGPVTVIGGQQATQNGCPIGVRTTALVTAV